MRRRLLVVAAALTALVAAADLTGALDLTPVRAAAGVALGPLERLVGPRPAATDTARTREAVATMLGDPTAIGTGSDPLSRMLSRPGLAGSHVVVARVVAVGTSGPSGPQRVTIDAGSRDGVEADRTVLAADGLVGRVVAVAPWTSDVLVVGGPDLTVGVRVGERGVMGEASGAAQPGAPAPEPGTLSLAMVQRGEVAEGDAVVTLGSVGGRPYLPGIPVGTVREVSPAAGRLAPTGTVVPAVDPTSLDLVAVVVDPARSAPRPVITASPDPTRSG